MAKVKKPFFVLSLDGGGIRGLMSAVWLAAVEKRLGGPIGTRLSLVAGTSTGSILAAAVASGIPAEEIVRLYETHGSTVFPSTAERLWSRARRLFSEGPSAPKYDGEGLEQVLRLAFGAAKFGDLPVRTMVVAYDVRRRNATVMKSWREEYRDLDVADVVKASCSAPTYFPAHLVRIEGEVEPLVDGGVVANNPTACAIAEAIRLREKRSLDDLLVLSIGTGESTREISAAQAKEWGALEWAVPVIDVLMDGAADAVDYIAARLLPDGRYFRLQTRLTEALDDMDDATRANLAALKKAARDRLRTKEAKDLLDGLAAATGAP